MKYTKCVVLVLFLISTLVDSKISIASEQFPPLDPIIINSSRIPMTLENSIASTVIIDRQQIDASPANNVSELLRYQAGIHVQQIGSQGAVGSVFLRNNDPNFVVIIIDGVKVNDPTNSRGGSFDFASIDLNSVERIEIVKGAMSSMHGSDALSGAIYITTRPVSEKPASQVTYKAGTNNYQEMSALAQQRVINTDLSLNVAYLDEGEQVDYSGFINRSVNLSTDSYIANGRKLSFHGRYNESDARSLPDDSGGEQYAVIRESELREVRESSVGLTYKQDVSSEASFTVVANTYSHDERVNSPGVAPGVRDPVGIPANSSDSLFTRHYLMWNNNYEVNSDVQFSVGLDFQREYGKSDSVLDTGFGLVPGSYRLKRKNKGVFIETLLGKEANLTTKLGIRHDMPKALPRETTANLGMRYEFSQYIIVTASIGSGYKLPSFFALKNPFVGNENLVPEKSQYWEAGIRQISTDRTVEWRFNLYAYEFEDLVDFEAGPPPILLNRSKVTSEGAETGVRQQLTKSDTVSVELAYSNTNIIGTNAKLLNRPRWKATGEYLHKFSGTLTMATSLVYVDSVYESSIATGDVELDAFTRLDLSVNWQAAKIWMIGGVIENLTDEEYQQTVGTDSPGTTVRAYVTAKL